MPKLMNALISLIVLSLLLVTGCGAKEKNTVSEQSVKSSTQAAATEEKNTADKLIVYYFHTTYRCWSCDQFEKLTGEVIRESFAQELADSVISVRVINIEEEPNRHFVNDYKLVTKSLILSLRNDDRELEWTNLDKIWQLVRQSERFKEYVKDSLDAYM